MKLCECGCGQPAPIATTNDRARGWVKGQPKLFISGHCRRGVPSPLKGKSAKPRVYETQFLYGRRFS
jgi:hypothetical protein